MLSMPVWEEGGRHDWTLAMKIEEVGWYVSFKFFGPLD